MTRNRRLITLFVTVGILATSFTSLAQQEVSQQDDPVRTILDSLTLEQKVGQMFMLNLYGTSLNYMDRLLLEDYQPGGVILFTSNIQTPSQIAALTNSYQQTIVDGGGLPLLIATDQEGGWIARLRDGFTEWPPMSLLTASGDGALAERVGAAMGRELTAVGINMNLAPVADMDTNIHNPIIGRRSPGSNLNLLRETLPGYVRGLQSVGILGTAKHFPGHGDTDTDSHVMLPIIDYDLPFLSERELQPFMSTIDADVAAVMIAHIWFSALDAEPLPASLSYNVVTGVLRDTLGYDGLIVTDALDMDAIDTVYTYEEAAIMAINAGADLLAYGPGADQRSVVDAMDAIIEAVRAGDIPEARINESVYRIIQAKLDYGILDWTPVEPAEADTRIDVAGTFSLVAEMFHEGITVAFDPQGLVPVKPDQRVGIIYFAQRPNIATECGALHDDLRWLALPDYPDEAQTQAAEALASQVDTVIVFTQNIDESTSYQALVNRLPLEKTIAVALRAPYDVMTYPDVAAYVLTYGPQEQAIPIVCGILFGAMEPRGTLSVNLPIER